MHTTIKIPGNSNTTLVKVKSDYINQQNNQVRYSNTTLVKVKYNLDKPTVDAVMHSNTTLVKVKSK